MPVKQSTDGERRRGGGGGRLGGGWENERNFGLRFVLIS